MTCCTTNTRRIRKKPKEDDKVIMGNASTPENTDTIFYSTCPLSCHLIKKLLVSNGTLRSGLAANYCIDDAQIVVAMYAKSRG